MNVKPEQLPSAKAEWSEVGMILNYFSRVVAFGAGVLIAFNVSAGRGAAVGDVVFSVWGVFCLWFAFRR